MRQSSTISPHHASLFLDQRTSAANHQSALERTSPRHTTFGSLEMDPGSAGKTQSLVFRERRHDPSERSVDSRHPDT